MPSIFFAFREPRLFNHFDKDGDGKIATRLSLERFLVGVGVLASFLPTSGDVFLVSFVLLLPFCYFFWYFSLAFLRFLVVFGVDLTRMKAGHRLRSSTDLWRPSEVIEDVTFLENWNPLPFLVVAPNYKALRG